MLDAITCNEFTTFNGLEHLSRGPIGILLEEGADVMWPRTGGDL